MQLNREQDSVYCPACLTWHDIETEVMVLNEVDVVCERSYPEHYILLGYIWDVPKWVVPDEDYK